MAVSPAPRRDVYEPPPAAVGPGRISGLSLAGLVLTLMGAWAGGVAFWGPAIHLAAPGDTVAWHWDWQNIILNLIPGAVGCLAGLIILSSLPALRWLATRWFSGLAAIAAVAAGAWMILGRQIWALSGHTGGTMPVATLHDLIVLWSYWLVPGLTLAAFGAWALGLYWLGRRMVYGARPYAATAPTTTAPTPVRRTDAAV